MRPSTRHATLASLAATLVGLIGVVGACTPRPPSSPPVVTAASTDAGAPTARAAATTAPPPAPASTIVEGPPPPAPRCRLTVTDTAGCQPEQVADMVSPVRSRIEHCRGATGGKLTVRVQRVPGGKVVFDAAPGTSLDPRERTCVLDALNSLYKEGDSTTTPWTGGSALPPTGFTSLLTIEW